MKKTPLTRKTPLKRSPLTRRSKKKLKNALERPDFEQLKLSWRRSKPPKDRSVYKNKVRTGKGITRTKPMRRVSKKKVKVMRTQYLPLNSEILTRRENRYCWICLCRSLNCTVSELRPIMAMTNDESDRLIRLSGGMASKATELHHFAGRIGRLLAFEPYLLASCFGCRTFPHTSYGEARQLELLASAPKYNVFPEADRERIEAEFAEWVAECRSNDGTEVFDKSKKAT